MALATSTNWEVRTGGNDLNGAGFAAGLAPSSPAPLSATSADTASPVVTASGYSFVAGDVGHWVFIRAGTNWTPGWYRIASVNTGTGAATLDAAVGAAILYSSNASLSAVGFNTTVGCATVASPSSGSWAMDYSQSDTAPFSGTNLTVDGTTNTDVLPDGVTPNHNHIGNQIYIASGTGFTVGYYQIASIQSGKWRLDRSPAAVGTSGGVWKLGGAAASPGQIGGAVVGSNSVWIKSGTYTVTSASSNVSGGCFSLSGISAVRIEGYGTLRTDLTERPIIQADGTITTFTLMTVAGTSFVSNIDFDGNSRSSSRGLTNGSNGYVFRVVGRNCTNGGLVVQGYAIECLVTGCSTTHAFNASGRCLYINCVAVSNSGVNGFFGDFAAFGCVSAYNNIGFNLNSSGSSVTDSVAYGNSSHGVSISASTGTVTTSILVSNGGWGVTDSTSYRRPSFTYMCATYNNTSGGINAGEARLSHITLTGDPFIDGPGRNYALNDTAGAGAECRQIMRLLPGIPTLSYPALGAAQPYQPTNAEIAEAVWGYSDRSLT